MPTFKFKNGETITANSLEEARGMRKTSPGAAPEPSIRPSLPPWLNRGTGDLLKNTKGDQKVLNAIKTANEITSSKVASGDSAKIKEIAESGLRQTSELGKEILSGNMLIASEIPFMDRKTKFIRKDLADLLGRLRSGGAISYGGKGASDSEGATFEELIPGWKDFSIDDKIYKLNELQNKFGGVAKSIGSDMSFAPFKKISDAEDVSSPETQPITHPDPMKQKRLEELRALQSGMGAK